MKRVTIICCLLAAAVLITGFTPTYPPEAGVWTDEHTYVNQYAGFVFQLPEGWSYATDGVPLAELPSRSFYDDVTMNNEATGTTVRVTYHNLADAGDFGTLEFLLDSWAGSHLKVAQFYVDRQSGVPVGSYNFEMLTGYINGEVPYNALLLARQEGDHFISVSAKLYGGDTVEGLLACFAALPA